MNKWLTKKGLVIISLIGSVVFFVSIFTNIHIPVDVCYQGEFCGDLSELLGIYFLLFIPVFIFSIIIFKLRESVFSTWRNFSLWAVPISLIVISFLPTDTHGLDFIPITKGTIIFFLTILYSLISLILIIYKSLKRE